MKMKTNRIVLVFMLPVVLAAAFFSSSCKGRIKVVPEISGSLKDESVLDLKDEEVFVKTIIDTNSEVVFFTTRGKIYRLNPEKKMLTFLYDLTVDIHPEVIHQGNVVVLKKKDIHDYIIFDLRQMKVIKTLVNLKADRIVCADDGVVGYVSENRLTFMDYLTGKILTQSPLDTAGAGPDAAVETDKPRETVFFNSEQIDEGAGAKTLILSSRMLYIFYKNQTAIRTVNLEHPAGSGFLRDGGSIYYGTENRELVKLSLDADSAKADVKWRFKLADGLKTKPLKAGPYIVIVPADNNIYFFNKRGTLYWWQRLDSSRLLPPLVMKENVAVFLWNKSVKFFDFKKKRIVTYPFNRDVFSNSLYIDEYVYVIAQQELEEVTASGEEIDSAEETASIEETASGSEEEESVPKTVARIGNNYGVKIETDPEEIIPMGKSIKFNLERFNLIEPELTVKILGPTGESVFDQTFSAKDDPYFIWIPEKSAEYKLVVEINAENKKGLRIEEPFNVLDLENILNRYYYEVQKSSNEDRVVLRFSKVKKKRHGKAGKISEDEED